LMLIASRRQIECQELGGGYVNNWDTFAFARYVRARDPESRLLLARDHGGPWQHPIEIERYRDISDAMESAKLSYLRDIEAGFDILHIDPVVYPGQPAPSIDWVLDKVFELYAYCMDVAKALGREILIELGTEEQQESPLSDPRTLETLLDRVFEFCEARDYEPPAFIVVQTGTKVMGRRNIGDFPSTPSEIATYVEQHRLTELVRICESRNVMLKEHNTDYLSDSSLGFHPSIGIHAANVAPEFGVAETMVLLSILEQYNMTEGVDAFIGTAVASRKWEKWLIPGESVSDREKAIICGHYIFASDDVRQIKRRLQAKLDANGRDLDEELRIAVKQSIYRYVHNFRLDR
jgi:hypothetical protein